MNFTAAQGAHLFKLPFAATGLLQALFQGITRIELRRILAEVVLAGQVAPEQLATVPCQPLEAAAAALGSPLRLGALYSAT